MKRMYLATLLLLPLPAWAGGKVAALPGPGGDKPDGPDAHIEAITAIEEEAVPLVAAAVRQGARMRLACLELRRETLRGLLLDAEAARERHASALLSDDAAGQRQALALLRQLRARAEELAVELRGCDELDRPDRSGTTVVGPSWPAGEFGGPPTSGTRTGAGGR